MLGLIYAPHTSAGRLPTEAGLRFFVDSFLEIGDLGSAERSSIEAKVQDASEGRTLENVLTEASQVLSGLSRSAGLVMAAKADLRLRHIEFIRLEPQKALVVIVGENGLVENRVIALPPGVSPRPRCRRRRTTSTPRSPGARSPRRRRNWPVCMRPPATNLMRWRKILSIPALPYGPAAPRRTPAA